MFPPYEHAVTHTACLPDIPNCLAAVSAFDLCTGRRRPHVTPLSKLHFLPVWVVSNLILTLKPEHTRGNLQGIPDFPGAILTKMRNTSEFNAHALLLWRIHTFTQNSWLNQRGATSTNHLLVGNYATRAFLGRALVIVGSWHAIFSAFPYLY